MEQTTQQNIQKPAFPTKTKVAAWLMIVIGGITIIEEIIYGRGATALISSIFTGIAILSGLIFILSGFFILLKKRIGWWLSISIISINLISALFYHIMTNSVLEFRIFSFSPSLLLVFPILLPLTSRSIPVYINGFQVVILTIPFLLLLDRKNFFKIAK